MDSAGGPLFAAHARMASRTPSNVAASWEQADEDRSNIGWAREAWNDMKRFSTGGTYINFLTEDEGPERIEAALGKGLQRLAEVKARWDPENVFRTNRNIKPA
jgi:hypothetical protein